MTKQLLSVDGFRASVKDGEVMPPDAMVVSASGGEPQATQGRRIKFVFSDNSIDRARDKINQNGWDLSTFVKNPVALFAHDSSSLHSVLGKALNVATISNQLRGEIDFTTADINPFADTAFKMVKAGLLSAVSVGFLPIDYAFATDKDRTGGIDFQRQQLLEISLCAIPANPNALVIARSMGIDTVPIADWAERILSSDGKVLVPRPFLEATFRAAKTPRSVRNKYLNGTAAVATHKAAGSDWKVGAARDLPLDDSGAAWDGPAAAASIFASAGFDGNSPDSAKARRGFLIYDSANPALKGSYKLPFARVSDGTMKAMPSGIRAAASRLPQTDAPSSVLDDARKVLDGYETKMQAADSGKMLETHRDMGAVAALAWLLDRLADIEDAVEAEENSEGDGSGISGRLQAAVASLGQILVDMTAEEVAELASDSEDDDASDDSNGMMPMMMSARTPGQKALMRLAMIAQAKAGRVLSAANSALLEQAKACHQKALDCMGQSMDQMSGAMDQHAKAIEMHQEAARCVKAVLGGEQEPDADEANGMDNDPTPTDHVVAEAPEVTEKDDSAAADAERQRRNRARARALELSMPV